MRFVYSAALVATVLAVSACERTSPEAASGPASPAAASTAVQQADAAPASQASPELRIATLDGEQYDLADHRGKWVVVNFWATWCAPCLKELPELSALDAEHEHVEVVGLAYEEIEPADLRKFLEQNPVSYPIAIVDVNQPPAAFATPRGLPMTYLIAPDGTVAEKFLGPVTAEQIASEIAQAGGPAAT